MKKLLFLCLPLVLLLAGQASAASDNRLSEYEERRRAVAALMESATVWVVGKSEEGIAQGSGFLVGDGLIATNAHVANAFRKDAVIYVLNDKIPATKARIVAQIYEPRRGRDFALLRFNPPQGVVLPILTFNLDAKRMDRVSAWGYPAMVTQFDNRTNSLERGGTDDLKAPPVVYTEGTINSIVSGQRGDALIHSAQIAGGNSGGPLVNSRGELLGMNTWGHTEEGEGAFLNAALPANTLAAFLAAHGANPRLVSGQTITARFDPPVAQGRQAHPAPSNPGKRKPTTGNRIRDVGSFAVEVPHGWSVVEEEEDGIILGADDGAALVSIEIGESGGLSVKQIARKLAEEFGGTRPDTDDNGESYTFAFSHDDMEYMAFVAALDNGKHALILVGGDTDNLGVMQILDSITDK